jgi:hypothetical protein
MVVREPADPIAKRFRQLRPAERVQKVLEVLATERPPE